MLDRSTNPPSTAPEELLDRWLDALNQPNGSAPTTPPPEIEGIATIARHYRQTLGDTTATHCAVAERNGSMNHVLPLSTANRDTWQTINPPRRRPSSTSGWFSWITNGLATALVVALLVALGGAMIVQQTGLPGGSDNPTALPGMAGQPGATPEGGSLDCSSPGYRPVVEGEVNDETLAMIGVDEQPIVIGDDEVTVPLSDGGEFTAPEGDFVTFGPGAMVTHFEDGSSTVTRLTDGESWDFPAIEPTRFANFNVFGNGRYYVAPTDDTLTNWHVLDTATGEQTTTADILGELFQGPLSPLGFGPSSSTDDRSIFVLVFEQSITGAVLTESSGFSPNALVIPDDLSDAYFGWLSVNTIVSPGGAYLASYNEIVETATGENYTGVPSDDFRGYVQGIFIAFLDDEPTILMYTGNEVRSIRPSTGEDDVVYRADAPIQAVGYDRASRSLAIGTGEQEAERWALLQLQTDLSSPLPGLDGYHLNRTGPLEAVRPLDGVADFVQPGDGDTYAIRALDMQTGGVSAAMTNTTPEDAWDVPFYPTNAYDGIVTAQTASGGFVVIDPAVNTQFVIPAPDNIDLSTDPYLSLSASPSGQCLTLNAYDEAFNPIHNTFVAPIAPSTAWTELDVRISQWVDISDDAEAETLLAQNIASPVATPGD